MGEMGVDRSGAAVFANFNPSLHIVDESEVEEILKSVPSMYRGIDFGFYRPAAVWGILDEWSRLIVVGEYLGQSEPLDAFVQRLKRIDVERFGGKRVLADYHDPHSTYTTDVVKVDRAEILRESGLNPVPALGGSVESGILLMQTLMDRLVMGKPLLMVSSSCRLLIEGFRGGYVWDENGKKPKKTGVYEHLFDALRYLVTGLNKKIGVGTWQRHEVDFSEPRIRRGLTYTETFKVR
jgi:hypothetical protein